MRIKKGYWVWGLFSHKEKNLLNEIKAKVQSQLKGPAFETHITLTGPYLNIDKKFFNKLKTFVESNSFIMLDIEGYDFKQEMFKSFYISIENSNSQLTYDEPDDLVANLSPDERAALMEELRQAMNEAAKELDFEEAARLRDRLHELERWND